MSLIVIGCALALAGCLPPAAPPTATTSTSTTTSTTTTLPPQVPELPRRPFASTSPWYTVLPNSAGTGNFAYGQEIAAEIVQYFQHASLNTQQFAPALYTVDADQQTSVVAEWDCEGKGKPDLGFQSQMDAVPIPADAVIPTDSDASVAVWQPSTDTVWELYKARRVDGAWQACWGGRMDHASTNVGTFPFPYGATATGISLLAGVVTLDDLRSGHIDHAIAIGVLNTKSKTVSWPANRTDGRSSKVDAVPEGLRLRLDPSIDLSTLKLTPLGRMIAVAMQRYGVIARDTSGSVAVYAQNPLPFMAGGQTDPYHELYAGLPKYAQLDGIPWERLEALPLDYGKP